MDGLRRSNVIDALKGAAILSVVLFHLDLFQYGWLGVDLFFIIAGYLSMRGVVKRCDGQFHLLEYILLKVKRLLPLVLVASAVVLLLGYVIFIPIQYKEAAASVISSGCFCHNIKMWVSIGDYWAATNELKPFMHLWYLGALMQMYVIFALCMCGARGMVSVKRRTWLVLAAGMISFVLWMMNIPDSGASYYLVTSRFFEFAIGVGLAWIKLPELSIPRIPVLTSLGMASYSIYIWHQVVIAFCKYLSTEDLLSLEGAASLIICVICVCMFSILSYRWLERNDHIKKTMSHPLVLSACFLVMNAVAGFVWVKNGVFRDYPELDIPAPPGVLSDSAYNDRIRRIVPDAFAESSHVRILVVGDSFARDLINVFFESSYSNAVNIAYCETGRLPEGMDRRIGNADIILYSRGGFSTQLPACLGQYLKSCKSIEQSKLYVVGCKYLGGKRVGRFSARRYLDVEYTRKCRVPRSVWRQNEADKQAYGAHYLDVLSFMVDNDGTVAMYPDGSGKLVSTDAYHFSRHGAKYYSEKLVPWVLKACGDVK